jgi:hypothetical protein
VRREAANRVTIYCWHQRQCGAVGVHLGQCRHISMSKLVSIITSLRGSEKLYIGDGGWVSPPRRSHAPRARGRSAPASAVPRPPPPGDWWWRSPSPPPAPSLTPTVDGHAVSSFSTHGHQSAAKGSSTTVSRSDIRLIQRFDFSAHGLVRRWLLIGYFLIHLLLPARSVSARAFHAL